MGVTFLKFVAVAVEMKLLAGGFGGRKRGLGSDTTCQS